MPNIHQMKERKFLGQQDVPQPMLVTVTGCNRHNIAKDDAPQELKYCLEYAEFPDKPHVMNWTNLQLCAQVFGSEDTDDWTGKKLVLYVDPNVSYGGKITGGLRVRKPKNQAAVQKPAAKPAAVAVADDDDDSTPF